MAQKLAGKSAVVTGGGDGIGRAAALAIAAEGARVVVNDIGKDAAGKSQADKVVEEIKKAGGTAVANYDTVATVPGARNIIKTVKTNFGRIDILVNCAGNYLPGTIEDMTEENWDGVMDVHLKGTFLCIQAAIKDMVAQKYGRIVNISSNGAFMFIPGMSRSIAYGTAKAGIMGLTATLSVNYIRHGITVNALLPGAITKLFPAPTKGGFGDKKRQGPEYVAPTIAYLVSEEAGKITGQYIYTAGGELCVYNRPFQLPGPHMFVRKMGMWTFDELAEVLPSIVTT